MKYKLLYSPAAAADLEEINEYIAGELCSPAAARNVIGGILDAAEKLEDFPNMGTPLRRDYMRILFGDGEQAE